jgi:hypothetical protein
MALAPDETTTLAELEADFLRAGGRGPELADEIDALRLKRDTQVVEAIFKIVLRIDNDTDDEGASAADAFGEYLIENPMPQPTSVEPMSESTTAPAPELLAQADALRAILDRAADGLPAEHHAARNAIAITAPILDGFNRTMFAATGEVFGPGENLDELFALLLGNLRLMADTAGSNWDNAVDMAAGYYIADTDNDARRAAGEDTTDTGELSARTLYVDTAEDTAHPLLPLT